MAFVVMVPANLKLEDLSMSFPFYDLPTKERSSQYLYYIVNTLVTLNEKAGSWYKMHNGFTSLCSTYLKEIHQQYPTLLSYLVESGVFECDNTFVQGQKCTGYKLTDIYSGTPLRSILLDDYVLCKAIKRQQCELVTEKEKELKPFRHILKWYLNKGLQVNFEEALIWIQSDCQRQIDLIEVSSFTPDQKVLERNYVLEASKASKRFIERIHSRDYDITHFASDEFGGRLHGMFTFHRKELRRFFTYRGKKLVALDIKNSQPFFSCVLLNPQFWKSRKTKGEYLRLSQINPEIYKEVREDEHIYKSITLLDSSESLIQRRLQQRAYVEDVTSGLLYEKFKRRFLEVTPEPQIVEFLPKMETREHVKKQVFVALYGDERHRGKPGNLPSRVLAGMYPDVFIFFSQLKRKNYKLTARIIQQLESYCVLKLICKEISIEKPELPIFTIHDSIVTTVGNEHYVKGKMEELLRTHLRISPTLSIEYWL